MPRLVAKRRTGSDSAMVGRWREWPRCLDYWPLVVASQSDTRCRRIQKMPRGRQQKEICERSSFICSLGEKFRNDFIVPEIKTESVNAVRLLLNAMRRV